MADFTSPLATAAYPAISSDDAGTVVAVLGEVTLSTAPAVNDRVLACKLPAGCVVVDVALVADDIDASGTPAMTLDCGIEGATDLFLAASTVAQTGGIARMSKAAGLRLAATDTDRIVLVTVKAAAATFAAGKIGVQLFYRAR